MNRLNIRHGTALLLGGVLGPGVLVLPQLGAAVAGPASILAWAALLLLSAPVALTFATLGMRYPDGGGAAAFARRAFGDRTAAVVGAWFYGVIPIGTFAGALVGADQAARALGLGHTAALAGAALLMAAAFAANAAGLHTSGRVQLWLLTLLVALLTTAVLTAATHADPANLTPFAPYGLPGIAAAIGVLLFAFAGWEAASHLSAEFTPAPNASATPPPPPGSPAPSAPPCPTPPPAPAASVMAPVLAGPSPAPARAASTGRPVARQAGIPVAAAPGTGTVAGRGPAPVAAVPVAGTVAGRGPEPVVAVPVTGMVAGSGPAPVTDAGSAAAAPGRDRRVLMRATQAALLVVGLLYLGLAVVTVAVLGPRAADAGALAALLEIGIGPAARPILAVAAVLLSFGAINTYLAGASRLGAALARDGVLPRWFARGGEPGAIPARSLGLLGGMTALFAVPIAAFDLDLDFLLRVTAACLAAVTVVGAASGARLLPAGRERRVAIAATLLSAAALTCCGLYLLVPAVLAVGTLLAPHRRTPPPVLAGAPTG